MSLQLAAENIRIAPAEQFHIGRGAAPRAIRISIGPPATSDQLRRALETINDKLMTTHESSTVTI